MEKISNFESRDIAQKATELTVTSQAWRPEFETLDQCKWGRK